MSQDERALVMEEIMVASRALAELEPPDADDAPSRLREELRTRRRALIARLRER